MYDLYSKLLAYGNRFPLNVYTDPSKTLRSLKEYDDCWHQYNPNKDIKFNFGVKFCIIIIFNRITIKNRYFF